MSSSGEFVLEAPPGQRAAWLVAWPLLGGWTVLVQVAASRLLDAARPLNATEVFVALAGVVSFMLIAGLVCWRLLARPMLVVSADQLCVRRGLLRTSVVHRRDIHRLWTESDRFARGVFIEHGTQGGMAIRRLPVPLDIVLPGLRHGAFEAELVSLQAWWSAGA